MHIQFRKDSWWSPQASGGKGKQLSFEEDVLLTVAKLSASSRTQNLQSHVQELNVEPWMGLEHLQSIQVKM